jgi:penicillin-insensitive murein endopeptidase
VGRLAGAAIAAGLWLGLAAAPGCVELGIIGDGTSVSIGRPSHGRISGGVRIPDSGEGYVTGAPWVARGQRYGTDELVDLIIATARRMAPRAGRRLVVADLSGAGGGPAHAWHRSHQSGRDVDLLFYVLGPSGEPLEPAGMQAFDARGAARGGSGRTVDVARTWELVKELITAPEAAVQWVFMYEPIAARLIDHAVAAGEPDRLVARARAALKQPGDSARHDDHLHVRVYCARDDAAAGCVDVGPMALLAEHEAELRAMRGAVAAAFAGARGARGAHGELGAAAPRRSRAEPPGEGSADEGAAAARGLGRSLPLRLPWGLRVGP